MADPNALTEDDLNVLIVSTKIERETSELHARFPAHLASFVSCGKIRIRQPTEQFTSGESGGANGSSFRTSKTTVYLSILINSENEADPQRTTKDFTLTCAYWRIFHYYLTGVTSSGTASVSVRYGDVSAKAFVTQYGDPGENIAEWSHGGIDEVFEELFEDLGVTEKPFPSEVELIEMLLGDHAKAYLDAKVEDCGPLREVIDKHDYKGPDSE